MAAKDFGNYQGFFKPVFNDEMVTQLIDDNNLYTKTFPRKASQKTGDRYVEAVELSREFGGTSKVSGDPGSLIEPTQGVIKQAEINTSHYTHRVEMSYDAISSAVDGANRAAAAAGGGRKGQKAGLEAFGNLSMDRVRAQIRDATFDKEIQYRYGCGAAADDSAGAISNLGEVASITAVTSGTKWINIEPSHWCQALFSSMVGRHLDIRTSAGAVRCADHPQITDSDNANTRIKVTGTEAQLATIADGDHLYWGDPADTETNYEREMVGIAAQLQNTGTIFGIDASAYPLWRPTVVSASGPLTMTVVQDAQETAIANGFDGEWLVFVATKVWNRLNNDEAALRDFMGDNKNYERGANKISYRSGGGVISIVQDRLQKNGYAFCLPAMGSVRRLGANEGTFNMAGKEMLQSRDARDAVERRYFWDAAILLATPVFGALIDSITA